MGQRQSHSLKPAEVGTREPAAAISSPSTAPSRAVPSANAEGPAQEEERTIVQAIPSAPLASSPHEGHLVHRLRDPASPPQIPAMPPLSLEPSEDDKKQRRGTSPLAKYGVWSLQAASWLLPLGVILAFAFGALPMRRPPPEYPEVQLAVDPADLQSKLLRVSLAASEAQYRINRRRRWEQRQEEMRAIEKVSVEELKDSFLVPLYPCGLESRIGYWGDGGKWVCLRHYRTGKAPIVISVGSNGDTSFEAAVAKQFNAFSHTFDFSLDPPTQRQLQEIPFLKFYNAGLSGSRDMRKYGTQFPGASFVTFPEMMKMIGSTYVDICKIDCEGCEIEVARDMAWHYTNATAPCGQIQIEVHFIEKTTEWMDLLFIFESLGYRMFHAEINGWWPRGYELAYVHERLVIPRGETLGMN